MPSLTPNYNFKKPDWDTEAADIRVFNDNMDIADEELKKLEENKQNKEDSTLKTIAKTVVGAINELFSNKLDKGGYTGTAKNLNDEISKKASKTVLGRMIVGDNLTVDDNGRVSGNPAYTHPTGNGNSHIPVNGASGNFLKWLSSGVAQWANITWSDITGKPNSFTPSTHTHDDRYFTESEINTKLDTKEPKIVTKNSAFNKPFGTSSNTVLEGSKLAEILGLTYGGSLNTSSAKTVNYAYYDSTTKKVYKCIKATSINYADATYFTAISNNDLLSKFQNLLNIWYKTGTFKTKLTLISISSKSFIGVRLALNGQVAIIPTAIFMSQKKIENRDNNGGNNFGFTCKYIDDTTIEITNIQGNNCHCDLIYLF